MGLTSKEIEVRFTPTKTAPTDKENPHQRLLGTAKFELGKTLVLNGIKIKHSAKSNTVFLEFPSYVTESGNRVYYHKVITPRSYRILLTKALVEVIKAWPAFFTPLPRKEVA